LREREILAGILDGSIFGIVECDIEVPDGLKDRFKDFQPIIKHANITIEDVGEHMKRFCEEQNILRTPRQSLIGSYFAKNHLIATDLLQWYLQEGLIVRRVHFIVQYHRQKVFTDFGEQVMDARRAADKDPAKKIVSDGMKLIGNSAFGRTIIDKEKFTTIKFLPAEDVNSISEAVNNKLFKKLDYIGESVAEIESHKRSCYIDTPVIIGFMILERSKLLLLKLVHYFLAKYFDRNTYCLLECDTDSMYIALSARDLFTLVRRDRRDEFQAEYGSWFAKTYCVEHEQNFFQTRFEGREWRESECDSCKSVTQYDNRTVGKFHLEWEGDGFIGLASKAYYCLGSGDKFSAKGVNRRMNKITFDHFKLVLSSRQNKSIINKGFRNVDHLHISATEDRAWVFLWQANSRKRWRYNISYTSVT
jgi:hypothetical protein